MLFACILAKRLAGCTGVYAEKRGIAAATSHGTRKHGLPALLAIPVSVWDPVEQVETRVKRVKPP